MGYFLATLLSYVLLYKYAAIFVIVLSAGLIIPWPENTLLLAVGAFASQGYFNIGIAFLTAFIANVLGDSIGYMLTNRWGTRFIKEEHIRKYKYIEKVDSYLKAYAALTIIVTRFVGALGPAVNFLSGLARIPFRTFILYDAIGNLLDIALCLVVGYAVGSVWQSFSGVIDVLGWILTAVTALGLVIRAAWRKRA